MVKTSVQYGHDARARASQERVHLPTTMRGMSALNRLSAQADRVLSAAEFASTFSPFPMPQSDMAMGA